MLMDAQNRPSNAQSLIAGAGTVVSTDSVDLLSAADNPGRSSGALRAVALLASTVTSGGAATLQVQLIQSDNSNLSSPDVLASGAVTALASLTAGAKLLDVPLPDVTKRYIGFQYVIGTAAITAGTITSGFVGGTDRPASLIPMNMG